MATRRKVMGEKPDGRLYSRITRRCVVLLKHIKEGRKFDLIEVAREVQENNYAEFLIRRGSQFTQIKADRIRDYLSYLVELQILRLSGKQYSLDFTKPSPSTDEHWAQTLSDTARKHLAKTLDIKATELPNHLDKIRKELHQKNRVPTVSAVIGETELEGARKEEVFRWSLYLYTDGDASPLEIRQYAHFVSKT